ncbi:unnamed protein product [Rhizophagus irregularis]|uniref:MATA_HMG n=1 Tax=Rhizophagus irregularis TaxID=588596 RepID=R9UCX6_9GLOM|nr:MATA_HMG [Rhizophagus irregularis]CAB4379969.1 unnamed protein product [Rhizophagus irregularis]CAB5298489.1 unnamed protein product [Rhizophagus irregularis]
MKYPKIETMKMTCQSSNTNTKIALPFPPIIKAIDIVNRRKPSRFKSKSPNAFLIYRKAFLNELNRQNHNLRMTDVSKLVSNYWKGEPDNVKDAYRKIAQEVEVELNEKRKKTASYKIVWKNSKYSSRKRNQCEKIKKDKSEVNTKFRPAVSSNDKIFYQFVPVDTEFTSKPSKRNNKENKPSSVEPKIPSCNIPENPNSQNIESNYTQESNDIYDNPDLDLNLNVNQFTPSYNIQFEQFEENPVTNIEEYIFSEENVDQLLYFQNFQNLNLPYFNPPPLYM